MEGINGWLSFPNHDLAIRRFCQARVEQDQERDWDDSLDDIELFCNPFEHDHISSPSHDLDASEVDELVNSFINVDGNISPNNHQDLDHFRQELDTFSMINDDIGEVPMVIDGDQMKNIIETSAEDDQFNVADTEMVPKFFVEEVSNHVVVDQGLHLVHLLLACAEAVGCRDTRLANSILSQIWASLNPFGDSLQRVSHCFASGLKSRLSLLHHVNANGTFTDGAAAMDVPLVTREEKMEAFQLLYRTTPYIAFGFMAANEAIYQASQKESSLHVIDIGMEQTLQWPSLIRTLASRPEGPTAKLRITGLIDEQNFMDIEASMKALVEDAASLGMSLEFNLIAGQVTPSLLNSENLGLRKGEALFVNSITHLHKFVKESRGSLKAILQAIRKLNPTLLTVVEQDANHNGPFFLGRFLESLHYYSAVFDSLEAILLRNSPQRMKIEKLHFAEEIRNIVAYEGSDRTERHERADQWRRQLGRAGFQIAGLKCMSQARMMLSIYGCDGYTLASEKGCLLLGWKGRPVMLASAWQVNHNTSS